MHTSRTGTTEENNVEMLGHASAKDTRLLGGSGDMVPRKNFEI